MEGGQQLRHNQNAAVLVALHRGEGVFQRSERVAAGGAQVLVGHLVGHVLQEGAEVGALDGAAAAEFMKIFLDLMAKPERACLS